MGKTKTAFIEGVTEEQKSGKEAYEEKMRKKASAQKAADEKAKAQMKGMGLKGGERIKVVGGELPSEPAAEPVAETTEEGRPSPKLPKGHKVRSKKYSNARAKIDKTKTYPLVEAIKLIKDASYSKFDGTMELHLVVKKTGFSRNVTLPNFAGKEKKIEVADDKTIEKLKTGKIDFDVLLATADMMPKLVPFARVLGPKGLMPNPKTGTLIKSKKDAEKFSGNSFTLKTEKDQPIIHTVVGKVSQKEEELEENVNALLDAVNRKQLVKAYLKSTMSPSVKLTI